MKIAILLVLTILWLVLQDFLSRRDNFIFGLIIPVCIIIDGFLFLKLKVPHGEENEWIFRVVMVLGFSMSDYFSGRDRVKKKKKKELEKMTIKDL